MQDLAQHIVHTDDGYHSLDKLKAESKLTGAVKGTACAASSTNQDDKLMAVSKLMGTDKGPACAAPSTNQTPSFTTTCLDNKLQKESKLCGVLE